MVLLEADPALAFRAAAPDEGGSNNGGHQVGNPMAQATRLWSFDMLQNELGHFTSLLCFLRFLHDGLLA